MPTDGAEEAGRVLMARIRLGGIKAFERQAYLTSTCRSGGDVLRDICSRLAAERINLSLLTHVAGNGGRWSITAAGTGDADGFSSYIHWKESHGECTVGKLRRDVSMISVFPYHQRLDVIGSLLSTVAGKGIRLYGLASSPSAVTVLVSADDFKSAVDGLFDVFEFPTYSSPLDWHAAYRDQEELLSEIICSYEEALIKVYDVTSHNELDLWKITLPFSRLEDFGELLLALHHSEMRMPFLVSKTLPEETGLCFAFCVATGGRVRVKELLERRMPDRECCLSGPVSVFFLHGPHFGDRYGIASTLVTCLDNAKIVPLAVSCAVSSMSVVVDDRDSQRIMGALRSSFLIPGRER